MIKLNDIINSAKIYFGENCNIVQISNQSFILRLNNSEYIYFIDQRNKHVQIEFKLTDEKFGPDINLIKKFLQDFYSGSFADDFEAMKILDDLIGSGKVSLSELTTYFFGYNRAVTDLSA